MPGLHLVSTLPSVCVCVCVGVWVCGCVGVWVGGCVMYIPLIISMQRLI